jgi:hypothetical protein
MWVSTHVFAGLAIAVAIGGPWWLVLPVVIAAHVVMDLVPHWDYSSSRHPLAFGLCDFVASIAVWLFCWLVLGLPAWLAFMGPVSGFPDWDVLVATLRGKHARQFFPSHWDGFPHGTSGRAWGIGVQVFIMAASLAFVIAASTPH